MKVAIGIPVIGGVPGEVYCSHLALLASIGRRCEVVIPSVLNVFPHARAREVIVDKALELKADYLLFVDSDMEVPNDAFDKLLRTLKSRPNVAMVCGHFLRRGYPYTTTWFKVFPNPEDPEKSQWFPVTAKQGQHELDFCGLACNLIDLKWLKQHLSRPRFRQGFMDEHYIWDDSWFCLSIRDRNGIILGDADVRVGHLTSGVILDDSTELELRRRHMALNPVPQGKHIGRSSRDGCGIES